MKLTIKNPKVLADLFITSIKIDRVGTTTHGRPILAVTVKLGHRDLTTRIKQIVAPDISPSEIVALQNAEIPLTHENTTRSDLAKIIIEDHAGDLSVVELELKGFDAHDLEYIAFHATDDNERSVVCIPPDFTAPANPRDHAHYALSTFERDEVWKKAAEFVSSGHMRLTAW